MQPSADEFRLANPLRAKGVSLPVRTLTSPRSVAYDQRWKVPPLPEESFRTWSRRKLLSGFQACWDIERRDFNTSHRKQVRKINSNVIRMRLVSICADVMGNKQQHSSLILERI